MLASAGSQKLGGILPQIFADNTRWSYRFLVNNLFNTGIPVGSLKPLASSPNRDLRKAAAILLGKPANKKAIPILYSLSGDKIKDIRREAVHSLGRVGSIEAIPILSDRLSDVNPQVRAGVATALGELKDDTTLCLLDRLAADPNFEVRLQAFFALQQFGQSGKNIIRKYQIKYPEIAQEFLSPNRGREYGA
jgi:HEAT repeat protein